MHDEEESLFVDVPRGEVDVMHGSRVVVAVDGSPGSKAALRFALEDAARRGVPVEAVISYRGPEMYEDFDAIGSRDDEQLRATLRSRHESKVRAVVEEVARRMSGPLPDVQIRAVAGPPADVLVRESHGADLLVVGSRGHGGFQAMLLGSTSIQCVMHATCPVTVVHSPEARSHRLRLHRDRPEEPKGERRGRVDALTQAVAPPP